MERSYEEEFEGLARYIHDEEERKSLIKFRRSLTPYGFELFIAQYFKEIEEYDTNTTEKYDKDCVDVEGMKGKEEIIIQCKLWQTLTKNYSIKIKNVREFYGAIQYRIHNNIRLVYITTTWISPNAIDFCEANNIEIWDYKNIIGILKEYPFNRFLNYILNNKKGHKYKEIFEKNIIEYIEEEKTKKKQTIIQETKKEVLIERIYISKKQKNSRAKVFILAMIFLYIFISIVSFITNQVERIFEQTKQQTSIRQVIPENPMPTKKRNIQKTIHTVIPQ